MKILILILLLIPFESFSKKTDKQKPYFSKGIIVANQFELTPSKCSITGKVDGKLKTMEGELVTLFCKVNDNTASCAAKGKQAEKYSVVRIENKAMIDSVYGNIKIFTNFEEGYFTLGSTHYILETNSAMTKFCMGNVKIKN